MVELLQPYQQIATLVFSAVIAISTAVYAVLTALLVTETRRMRRVQTEPKVIAFIKPRQGAESYFAYICFQNIGSGPAFDISFELTANKDDEEANLLISDFSRSLCIDTGVDYIGPSQGIQSCGTVLNKETSKKIEAIFSVTIKYKSYTNRKYSDTYAIDMSAIRARM